MTEKELARGAAHRLAIIRHAQEMTGNVALTCRYFGITRAKSATEEGDLISGDHRIDEMEEHLRDLGYLE